MSSSRTGISSEICRSYSRGWRCWRELRGGCPYVHDSLLRKEALERMKLKASRSELQLQYKPISTNVQQSEQANKTTSGGKAFNNDQSDSRHDTVLQKDALEEQNSSKEEIAPSQHHDTPGSTTLRVTFEKTSKTRQPCKYYTNGEYCRRQNKAVGCYYVHDLALRRATLAKNSMLKDADSGTSGSKRRFSAYTSSPQHRGEFLTMICTPDADTAEASSSKNPLDVPIERVGITIAPNSAAGNPSSHVIPTLSQLVPQETQTRQVCRDFTMGKCLKAESCYFVHDLAVCRTAPKERKKKGKTKKKLHEVVAQGQEEDRSIKPIIQQLSTPLNTSTCHISAENHRVMPRSGIDMRLLLDSTFQPGNDESKDQDPMQLHSIKQHRNLTPPALNLVLLHNELSNSELNVDSIRQRKALSRDAALSKPAKGVGRKTPSTKQTQSKSRQLDTAATAALEKMLKQNDNSKNLFQAQTNRPAPKQGSQDCISKKRGSKSIAAPYGTGKENNTSAGKAMSTLTSMDSKDIGTQPVRQLSAYKTVRGFQKSATVSKRFNSNVSQSKRPFWTEAEGESWSLSKSMKVSTKSDIEFPSLPPRNGDKAANATCISAPKTSILNFSTLFGSQKMQFVVGPRRGSKPNTTNHAGIRSITEAVAALEIVTEETTVEPWNLPDLRSWAFRNLTSNTAAKFLAPYVSKGRSSAKTPTMNKSETTARELFPHFSFFPPELRIQIWEDVLEGEKYEARIKWRWQSKSGYYTRSKFVPFNCVPRLLHVNHETRSLAMKRYELTFGTNTYRTLTYFDYNRDRLFVHTRSSGELQEIVKQMLPHDSSRVQRLALPLRDYVRNPSANEFATSITTFKGLQKLTLLVGDGREDERWAKNKKLAQKIQNVIGPVWWKINGVCKAPKVNIEVMDAVKAHQYGIDGLMWG